MKKSFIFIFLFILFAGLSFSYFNVNTYVKRCEMSVNKINLERAYELYNKKGFIFLDVREPREINKRGTIPGAKHIPRGLLEFRINKITSNNLNTPIIIFSNSTKRASLAAFTLSKTLGYKKVYRLDGGYEAWKKRGYPTTLKKPPLKHNKPQKPIIIKKIIKRK